MWHVNDMSAIDINCPICKEIFTGIHGASLFNNFEINVINVNERIH